MDVQFSSVTQRCPTLGDPMNRSMPGLPVHHHLSEFTQTHVHQVGDAIQPSHPLSSPQPVPPIRKLPQASYPYPSEGRQNGNHNHRKLITWITALPNSMKQ